MKLSVIAIIISLFAILTFYIFIDLCTGLYQQKTLLEIQILQHELKAYEEMEKELKSE